MKYRLERPKFSEIACEVIARINEEKGESYNKLSKKAILELKSCCEAIKKEGLPSFLVHQKLPDPLGYGIFLHPKAKPLKRGFLIGSYSGEVVIKPKKEPDESAYAFAPEDDFKILKKEFLELELKGTFSSSRLYTLYIDADKKGNFLRFINHSEKPNIEARLLRVPKNNDGLETSPLEVFYFVKKNIEPGEQLLVCYEDEEKSYWGALNIEPSPIFPKTYRLDKNLKLIGPD
jgi:hypothetical protein